jgi:hypothetical protein
MRSSKPFLQADGWFAGHVGNGHGRYWHKDCRTWSALLWRLQRTLTVAIGLQVGHLRESIDPDASAGARS